MKNQNCHQIEPPGHPVMEGTPHPQGPSRSGMGHSSAPRQAFMARWRFAAGFVAVVALGLAALSATQVHWGGGGDAEFGLLEEVPDGYFGRGTMLADHYDKDLRQRASAYWSAIAEQRDAARGLEKKGVHGVMPADVSIPLSARDYPDPSRAFKAAKIAHSQGWRTVHHIRASPIHTYPDLARGFAAIDAASREWSDHRYTLKQLDERIQEQYSALEKMYGQETKLAYRHKLITAELHRLMREADKISGEMLSIKGRYSQEINDLRDDYRADTREVKDATATAQKELEENNEQLALLREKVREAAVKAARYREEAQHSMEDVEGMRSRTLEHEAEWKLNKAEAKRAYHHEIKFRHDEADKIAEEKEEAVKAGSVREISRMSKATHTLLDKRLAMTIKTNALVDVEKELVGASRRAEASAEARGTETRLEMHDLQDEIQNLEARILEDKAEAAGAKVNATKFADESRTAKKKFDNIMHLEHQLRSKIINAEKSMKEAQAKKVEAETRAKLSEVAAEGAVSMSRHDTFEADEAQELVQNRTMGDEEELKALEEEIDGVVSKTIDAAKATYKSSMKGTLYGGQAKNQDELSDAVLNSAEAKEERADKLLKSVDALAALAKTAAEMARADNIKAHAEEIADAAAQPSEAAGPDAVEGDEDGDQGEEENEEEEGPEEEKEPESSTHSIPYPGSAFLERDDPGTKTFQEAGIKV